MRKWKAIGCWESLDALKKAIKWHRDLAESELQKTTIYRFLKPSGVSIEISFSDGSIKSLQWGGTGKELWDIINIGVSGEDIRSLKLVGDFRAANFLTDFSSDKYTKSGLGKWFVNIWGK